MAAVISRRRRSARRGLGAAGMLVVALAGACSSGGGADGHGAGSGIPADVAGALAARADRVAADLDAGACDQALTEARSLQGDLAALPADPAVRAEALAGAARLTTAITCSPPPAPAPSGPDTPPPKKRKGHGHEDGG